MNGHSIKREEHDSPNLLPAAELKEALHSINESQSKDSNLSNLREKIGGTDALLELLQTHSVNGLDSSQISSRRALYGSNFLPLSPRKSFWQLFIDTFDDETVQILAVAAVVSLAVGLYENPSSGYIEGVAILLAVLIVSVVTAVNDYQKETEFQKLNKVNEEADVVVVRDGKARKISTTEIVIGDLLCVEVGDKIPCDGVLVKADGLELDESALTGEPEEVGKGIDVLGNGDVDPFVLSGCATTAGMGSFVAIGVGKDSQWGIIKVALEKGDEQTPLQDKLDTMANQIGNVGIAAAVATFIAMMSIKIFVRPAYLADTSPWSHALDAFIIGVTIVVVAVPEGLPLAVTISLAYSTKKMLADNTLIRHLQACETMGNATCICSDKTGTLTENRMTVVSGIFASIRNDDIDSDKNNLAIADEAAEHILQGIATCSTAQITIIPAGDTGFDKTEIIGNKTEAALISLVSSNFFSNDNYQARRESANFGAPGGSRLFPFSSARKCMSVLVKSAEHEAANGVTTRSAMKKARASSEPWTLYQKGAAEIVIQNCTHYLAADGKVAQISSEKRNELAETIKTYAGRSLRCVALAHRLDIQKIVRPEDATEAICEELLEKDMVLDAVVGIIDPLRDDVVDAVRTCQDAGIMVRMVTGDSLDTAKSIAKEAGILSDGGLAMLGSDFRKLTPAQLDKFLPDLQVLARSSPDDKLILVRRLNGGLLPKTREEWLEAHPGKDFETQKDLLLPGYHDEWASTRQGGVGEIVGVTGDGTNDGPALRAADVGLAMGLSGTDVAKNASDIIIMDDKFSSIVKAVLWGRSVFDNIRKFLQFQLTVNVVALTITFLSALSGYSPPLNAVMMLWVNLIMDTMGALALGTEPPTMELLNRRPYRRDASLINLPMWRNITCQSIYQLLLLIFLLKYGPEVFDCEDASAHHFTILFNAFVFCQIFNEFNAREIGDRFDPLRRIGESPMFLAIIVFTVLSQWFIVSYGGEWTETVPLTVGEWRLTVLFGAMSIPVGFFMRLIPIDEDPQSFAGGAIRSQSKVSKKDETNWTMVLISVIPLVCALVYEMSNISTDLPLPPQIYEEVLASAPQIYEEVLTNVPEL